MGPTSVCVLCLANHKLKVRICEMVGKGRRYVRKAASRKKAKYGRHFGASDGNRRAGGFGGLRMGYGRKHVGRRRVRKVSTLNRRKALAALYKKSGHLAYNVTPRNYQPPRRVVQAAQVFNAVPADDKPVVRTYYIDRARHGPKVALRGPGPNPRGDTSTGQNREAAREARFRKIGQYGRDAVNAARRGVKNLDQVSMDLTGQPLASNLVWASLSGLARELNRRI